MNPRAAMPLNGYLLPDPWSTGVKPSPAHAFDDFYDFVKNAVQEHTTGSGSGSAKSFLQYMLRHGISFSTVSKAIGQLVEEKLSKDNWKRAIILDQFLLDVFKYFYRRVQPDYSTFFLNSTAHFQHCFWRHMDPDSFSSKPSAAELKKYGKAIQTGYESMDEILGKLLKIVGQETSIVFATALSQQPYLKDEASGGRHYFRLRSAATLTSVFGIKGMAAFEEVMADQFIMRFPDMQSRDQAQSQLESFRLDCNDSFSNGKPQLMNANPNDETSLMCQCRCTRGVPKNALITSNRLEGEHEFHDLFYEFSTLKGGCHHPDGILWIRHGESKPSEQPQRVSLRRVAPTILNLFDVPTPSYMSEPALTL